MRFLKLIGTKEILSCLKRLDLETHRFQQTLQRFPDGLVVVNYRN